MASLFTCPTWLDDRLVKTLRQWWLPPDQLLGPYLEPGMQVLDFGGLRGHFSIPTAHMIGNKGRLVCVNLTFNTLHHLREQAFRQSLTDRIELYSVNDDADVFTNGQENFDFTLAIDLLPTISAPERLFDHLYHCTRPHGKVLIAELRQRVSPSDFGNLIYIAENSGFDAIDVPQFRGMHALLLKKAAMPNRYEDQHTKEDLV